MKHLLLLIAVLCISMQCAAQENNDKERLIAQKVYPQGFDNISFMLLHFNSGNVYTIRGNSILETSEISDIKLNPSLSSFACVSKKTKGKSDVAVYDLVRRGFSARPLLYRIRVKDADVSAIAYSADAKRIAVASSDSKIMFYEPLKKVLLQTLASNIVPRRILFSGNNYFLAAADNSQIEIWNLERSTIRKSLQMRSTVNDIAFSSDDSRFLVLTADGRLSIYDTATFNLVITIDGLGEAKACCPNKDGKYVAVVSSPKNVVVVNVLNPAERREYTDERGLITDVSMVFDSFDNVSYLLHNDASSFVFKGLEWLTPYYGKMMNMMLTERLGLWMKQMPNETLEEYKNRVTETSRREKAKELEMEISTMLAGGLVETAVVSLGKYNTNTRKLAVNLRDMPTVFLDVPLDEVGAFTDVKNLQFRNPKYAITSIDKFELVYAEVYNTANGKTYTFSNFSRQSLAYMEEDANFVPLDIVQKTNMEEVKLQSMKEDLMSMAKQNQVITDKTHISVNTNAEPAVDADGNRIVNYNVGFTYEVDEEFSARDDFKPGHYHAEESKAATLMLQLMKNAFENDFAQYVKEGKRVKIKIKGTADASPISGTIKYDGRYGEYESEPVRKDGELTNISLDRKGGIGDNDQLAFARALGVKNYIDNEISGVRQMNSDYEYQIEVSKEKGSKFRRISVQYTFVDAF